VPVSGDQQLAASGNYFALTSFSLEMVIFMQGGVALLVFLVFLLWSLIVWSLCMWDPFGER
jgi:hypothetical protein